MVLVVGVFFPFAVVQDCVWTCCKSRFCRELPPSALSSLPPKPVDGQAFSYPVPAIWALT